jgi:ATP-binding cassette subfamily F protein uup
VLVLDEPTNDLDIDTLELLEDLLARYDGTVFLVSHDRSFLDNVVTSTIAYEGDGRWREYEGGVQDWLQQSQRSRALAQAAPVAAPAPSAGGTPKILNENTPQGASSKREQLPKKKLSYKDQRELEQLPERISALEAEQKTLQDELADGSLYTRDPARAAAALTRISAIEDELMTALERWESLAG